MEEDGRELDFAHHAVELRVFDEPCPLFLEPHDKVQRVVAVGGGRLDLRDAVVGHVEHGHGDGVAIVREDAHHAHLAAQQAETVAKTHGFSPPPLPTLQHAAQEAGFSAAGRAEQRGHAVAGQFKIHVQTEAGVAEFELGLNGHGSAVPATAVQNQQPQDGTRPLYVQCGARIYPPTLFLLRRLQ